MKIHFYNPNQVIFQKKHLNDVEIHIFLPFPSSYHHNFILFFKPLKIWALKKSIHIEMDFMN